MATSVGGQPAGTAGPGRCRTARINEAHRIASAVANSIAGKPRFVSVDVIHLDYVKRAAGSSSTDTVDALDFRKDPAGEFKFHVS